MMWPSHSDTDNVGEHFQEGTLLTKNFLPMKFSEWGRRKTSLKIHFKIFDPEINVTLKLSNSAKCKKYHRHLKITSWLDFYLPEPGKTVVN